MVDPVTPSLERVLARPESGARSVVDFALGRDRTRPETMPTSRPPVLKMRLSRTVHSRPVVVPRPDWEKVLVGSKRMYRTYSGSWRDRHAPLFPAGEEFPRPALIYSQLPYNQRYDAAVAVITAYRQEPLGAISPADVLAEGFERVSHFRRYWKRRYARWGWRPGDLISVVELRPWEEQDDEEQAAWLLRQLYGEWL